MVWGAERTQTKGRMYGYAETGQDVVGDLYSEEQAPSSECRVGVAEVEDYGVTWAFQAGGHQEDLEVVGEECRPSAAASRASTACNVLAAHQDTEDTERADCSA